MDIDPPFLMAAEAAWLPAESTMSDPVPLKLLPTRRLREPACPLVEVPDMRVTSPLSPLVIVF